MKNKIMEVWVGQFSFKYLSDLMGFVVKLSTAVGFLLGIFFLNSYLGQFGIPFPLDFSASPAAILIFGLFSVFLVSVFSFLFVLLVIPRVYISPKYYDLLINCGFWERESDSIYNPILNSVLNVVLLLICS